MGNPVFRFTLSHATLGTRVITEPDGWKDAKLKMERHPEFHSLVEYFEGAFIFYGENNVDDGGADFIRQCENLYGPDAEIQILIEADIDVDGVFEEEIFEGQLDLTGLKEVQDNKIQVPIIRNDLWAKFIARKDTPVNLRSTTDLDGAAVAQTEIVDINLTSQKIKKQFAGHLKSTRTFNESELTTSDYIQLDVDEYTLDEIKEKYALPISVNPAIPQGLFFVEEAGSYIFDLRVEVSIVHYDVDGTYPDTCHIDRTVTGSGAYLNLYLQINDDAALPFTETTTPLILTDIATVYTYSGSMSLKVGDQIKIYGDLVGNISDLGDAGATLWIHSVDGIGSVLVPQAVADVGAEVCTFLPATAPTNLNIQAPSLTAIPTYFNVTAHTIYPNTSAQAFFIHDAAYAIIKRICSSQGIYSEYLGSALTNGRQYLSSGCAWKNIILPGLQLRGYTMDQKQFAMSFMKWWNGADPLLMLGLGYEDVNSVETIRIENRARFFDATSVSVQFSNVREISRVYDTALLYNLIKAGFSKWQSEDISGLDDPQTKRDWATRGKKYDKALQIISDWIAASIAIEVTRRKTIEKSEDYKYDDEVFVIAINGDDVSPDRYLPELSEYFTSITGLENSSTRYNSIHTPLRMLLRWGAWWNGCLQKYQSSELKFVSGEGNYDMSSDYNCATGDQCLAVVCDNISEKGNISLSTYGGTFGYLHLPLLYTVEIINFTWEDYLLIRNNRRKAIGISQTIDNYKRFFIKELTYDVCKGKCKIIAWPYDEAPIRIVETDMPDRVDIDIPDVVVYDEDYQVILNYAESQGVNYREPSDEVKALQSALIVELKDEGLWDDIDILYVPAGDGLSNFAGINWKNPGTYQLTGTATYIENQGFSGDGAAEFLETQWIPSVDAVNFTLDECGAFCYVNNNHAAGTKAAFGTRGNGGGGLLGQIILMPEDGSSQHSFSLQNSAPAVGAGVSSNGFYHIRRVADNDLRLFKNGSQVGLTQTSASDSLSNRELYILALNANGAGAAFHSDAEIGILGIGASLTGKESALYTAWNNYFNSL